MTSMCGIIVAIAFLTVSSSLLRTEMIVGCICVRWTPYQKLQSLVIALLENGLCTLVKSIRERPMVEFCYKWVLEWIFHLLGRMTSTLFVVDQRWCSRKMSLASVVSSFICDLGFVAYFSWLRTRGMRCSSCRQNFKLCWTAHNIFADGWLCYSFASVISLDAWPLTSVPRFICCRVLLECHATLYHLLSVYLLKFQ